MEKEKRLNLQNLLASHKSGTTLEHFYKNTAEAQWKKDV